MSKYYFTFGQDHRHELNGMILDKDCVLEISASCVFEARQKMFDIFGQKWSNVYIKKPDMSFFNRGIFKYETLR